MVECRICNREVAGSNLSLGYFAPRYTQPSIPPGSVNEHQLRLGRQRQVRFIPIEDERVGVQVKLWNPLRTRAIPERFSGGDSLRKGAIVSVCTFIFTLFTYLLTYLHSLFRNRMEQKTGRQHAIIAYRQIQRENKIKLRYTHTLTANRYNVYQSHNSWSINL